jgi:hypothetical protein
MIGKSNFCFLADLTSWPQLHRLHTPSQQEAERVKALAIPFMGNGCFPIEPQSQMGHLYPIYYMLDIILAPKEKVK